MKKVQSEYLPTINSSEVDDDCCNEIDVIGDSACPCCGFITIPNKGDALAYICPVCCWEIDLFITSENEVSDQNHGLTLLEARKNYKQLGASLPRLKQYCRKPKKYEHPIK